LAVPAPEAAAKLQVVTGVTGWQGWQGDGVPVTLRYSRGWQGDKGTGYLSPSDTPVPLSQSKIFNVSRNYYPKLLPAFYSVTLTSTAAHRKYRDLRLC